MDLAYKIYFGAVVVGVSVLIGTMYLIHKRGIAVRLTWLMLGTLIPPALASFYLGKEGITVLSVGVVLVILVPLILGLLTLMIRQIVHPLKQLVAAADNAETDLQTLAVEMKKLAQGDLTSQLTLTAQTTTLTMQDEIGQMAGALNSMIVRVRETGNAFDQMVHNLSGLVGRVAENAVQVDAASKKLASASEQSGVATRQIATTIQQVTQGISQQTMAVTQTSAAVEQLNRAITSVAQGAQEQASAMSQAAQIASRIHAAIEQVASSAETVTRDSKEAANYSSSGAKTVQETIVGMEAIRAKVGVSAGKVEEMGVRSEEIGAIVETIEDIASQTNLLALNAAIEAARANGTGARVNEQLIQQHLLGAAGLLAELCACTKAPLTMQDLVVLAKQARVDMLNITDEDGVVILSNEPDSVGFRFPEDANQQAAAFRALLTQKDGVLAQPAKPRSQDGVLYIYAGVSRRDQAGVIQAGTAAAIIEKNGDATRGFAVVADEVRKLAERSNLATKQIANLIKSIQQTTREAVSAMQTSAAEVEAGVTRANSAGDVLNNIRVSAESVYRQAEAAGAAAGKVSAAANELVAAVESVSTVIAANTSTTQAMAANSSALTQSIENIASVSEENTASVEEVSASTEAVSAQVDEVAASAVALMGMADALQQVVLRFKV